MSAFKKVVPLKKCSVVIPKLFNLISNMNYAQQVRLLEKAEELCSKEKRLCECRMKQKQNQISLEDVSKKYERILMD